ncbi:MAG: hypothetical protein DBX48_04715 [Limosilactobacillus fermentum]|nr:MAG: hypothetical protein DBX48_04715 [Limosilactobacillus fermentum]
MSKILLILEVSRKQDYIFSSIHLRDNAARSDIIRYVTSEEFFKQAAPEYYNSRENFVYAGGGHTILQFGDRATATRFAEQVTQKAMREYDGLELFAKQMEYRETDENGKPATPGQNLVWLSEALEQKKSLRKASFRLTSLGIEKKAEAASLTAPNAIDPPKGWAFAKDFIDLQGRTDENFIAVVHIDGNSMGKRVKNLYDSETESWDTCCDKLRCFSEGIQHDFEAAFREMAAEVADYEAANPAGNTGILPVRPVILAGDDVCFVARGCLGLECAERFMKHLSVKTNPQDGETYAACAGVAMVHLKYPFHQAYDLAEALCSSAKKYGVSLCGDGSVSVMDWHIEFGQLKENLREIRSDYETEDGKRMELRPVVVLEGKMDKAARTKMNVRTYDFVRGMCMQMKQAVQESGEKIARGKLKELRGAIKQGDLECRYALQDSEITKLLRATFEAQFDTADKQYAQFAAMLKDGELIDKQPFRTFDDGGKNGSEPVSHCLFFDAIEMMDHFERLEGNV